MGGAEDWFLEGSVLGASFWRWWKQAWAGVDDEQTAVKVLPVPVPVPVLADHTQPPVDPVQELVYMASVVMPRPRPPPRCPPVKSEPIDIPTKKAVSVPVVEVAEDKRYWYQ